MNEESGTVISFPDNTAAMFRVVVDFVIGSVDLALGKSVVLSLQN